MLLALARQEAVFAELIDRQPWVAAGVATALVAAGLTLAATASAQAATGCQVGYTVSSQWSGNSRDLDAMDALHHPQVLAYTTGAAEATHSIPPHREVIEFVIRAFPDVRVHNDPDPIQFGQGGWTTAISTMTGTFTGEMIGPDGKAIAPTGKSFEVPFTTVARWEQGLIAEEWVFWDQPRLLEQIGLAG